MTFFRLSIPLWSRNFVKMRVITRCGNSIRRSLHKYGTQLEETENFEELQFQQNGATCHIAKISMATLREIFLRPAILPVRRYSLASSLPRSLSQ